MHRPGRGTGFLRGRSGVDLGQEIERLGVGVAYVSTPDSEQARKVYMGGDVPTADASRDDV